MSAVQTIKKLSHVALKVTDVTAAAGFYQQVVGLGETTRDSAGNVYLRCNADHHSLKLMTNGAAGIDHFALDVGDEAGLAAAADRLARAGIAYEESPEEPGQGPGIRLPDPDGFTVELVAGLEQVSPHYGPRAVQPRRIAHVTILVADPQASVAFYTEVLGFKISDWFSDVFCWLRCNPEHHSVAIARLERVGLHHLAFDVAHFGNLAHQGDHLVANGRHYLYGPGRHGPGNNQFAYFYDLDGHIVEFTCDSLQIWDDASYQYKVWQPSEKWVNLWGQDPPAEFLR